MKRILPFVWVAALAGVAVSCDGPITPPIDDPEGVILDELRAAGKAIPDGVVIIDTPDPSAPGLAERPASASVSAASTPFIWVSDFGTGLNQSDDDCDFVPFGFNFFFYGQPYDGVWVNSNGNVTFGECWTDWGRTDIPDGLTKIIAPLYGDFNPSSGGDVYVNTGMTSLFGRKVVVTWAGVPEYAGTPGPNTFQIQLYERTNYIVVGYNGLATDGINWSYYAPSTDPLMAVGISPGPFPTPFGSFVRSAEGTAIPALDGHNICYIPVAQRYMEFRDQICALFGILP
jgi:hypothetical protein